MTTIVSQDDYVDATENYLGWCTVCEAFTRENCEPDCRDYNCEQCGYEHSVMGAEEALMEGLLEFADE